MNQIRLVQYDSSSTSESEEESSSCSTTSSSSSPPSDHENDNNDDEDDDDQTNSSKKKSEKHQIKGEFDYLPPIEQLNISVEEVLCEPLGQVGWTVDQMVVVIPSPGKPTLNIDTILFLDRGKRVLGRIFDVFGKVSEPHYCVRFNTPDHIKENKVEANMSVYFVPNSEHTSLVFESELRKIKAVDEIDPEEEPYFSDDEAEEAYKRSKLKKNSDVPAKRSRQSNWQSKHPWSSHNVSQKTGNKQKQWQNQKQCLHGAWINPGYNNLYQNNNHGQYSCYRQQSPFQQKPKYPFQTFQELVNPSWSWSSNPSLPSTTTTPSSAPAPVSVASLPPSS